MKAIDILRQARESNRLYPKGTSICIYGEPKTGKTIFAATAAKAPHVDRVIIYDFEHSSDAIFGARYNNGELIFTNEDYEKIEIVYIPDTKQRPIGAETALKIVSTKNSFSIDDTGKVRPATGKEDFILDPKERGPNIVEIFDSGSQIADSILNMVFAKFEYKDLRKYYGEAAPLLADFLICIQQAQGVYVVVTHVSVTEVEQGNDTKEYLFPYMGSRTRSRLAAKYFDTVIYKELALKKFNNISTPTSRARIVAGSRYHINLEKIDNPTLADVLTWKGEAEANTVSQANLKQKLKQ